MTVWAFVAFLLLGYFGDLTQVPPSVTAVAVVGLLASAISLPWVWWFDRNRELRASPGAAASAAGPGPQPRPRA